MWKIWTTSLFSVVVGVQKNFHIVMVPTTSTMRQLVTMLVHWLSRRKLSEYFHQSVIAKILPCPSSRFPNNNYDDNSDSESFISYRHIYTNVVANVSHASMLATRFQFYILLAVVDRWINSFYFFSYSTSCLTLLDCEIEKRNLLDSYQVWPSITGDTFMQTHVHPFFPA